MPADRVGHVPTGLGLKEAGAIATTGLTAIQGIDDALHLTSGRTLIIHGAAGGVGSLALQFAKLRHVRVLATASGEDGLAFAQRLGADAVVDGRSGDIVAAARNFAPGGVDAVLAQVVSDADDAVLLKQAQDVLDWTGWDLPCGANGSCRVFDSTYVVVRIDRELVDRSGGARLRVEEPPLRGRGEVDRAGLGCRHDAGGGQQCRAAVGADPVRADRVAAGVRDVVRVPCLLDPAESDLPVGLGLRAGERPVGLDRVGRHAARPGLADDEAAGRVERERKGHRRGRRVRDGSGAERSAARDAEDVDVASARLRRHDQPAPVGREADLAGRGEEVRRVRVREAERPVPVEQPGEAP